MALMNENLSVNFLTLSGRELNDGAAIDLWLLSYPYCKIVNTSYDPTLILLVFLNRYGGHLECIE